MIRELSSLRFIFIVFVFLHHIGLYDGGGTMAVAFFFVLGGFCMTLGYKDKLVKEDFSYWQFIIKRGIKFYPLHWLLLAATLLLPMFSITDWAKLGLNAALLQSFVPIKSVYFSFNSVSWYLADTMFLSVAFPILGRFLFQSSQQIRSFIAVLLLLAYGALVFFLPVEKRHAILYINPLVRCMDFLMGVYLALLFLKIRDKEKIRALCKNNDILIGILSLFMIVFLVLLSELLSTDIQLISALYWPLVCLVIISVSLLGYSGSRRNIFRLKSLEGLGDSSLTFFMIHLLVIRCCGLLGTMNNIMILTFTSFAITLVASITLDKFALKPGTRWLTKVLLPSSTVQ